MTADQDMEASAVKIAEALDNTETFEAIRRYAINVSYTEEQTAQIKTLFETGKTVEAQRIVLDILDKAYGDL